MTRRAVCRAAPEPLEAYASRFDDLFARVAQRQAFREYLQGVLLPRDRNKTVTGIVGAEPVTGASDADVQHVDCFLAESTWHLDRVHQRRIELLLADPETTSHERGVLVIDDSGDRKWGTKMAYAARQYLGSIGKVDHGIVAVTSLWADERLYYPLHVRPYTPAERLAGGKRDPMFRTKPELALEIIDAALAMGVLFRAIVADISYGEDRALVRELNASGLPYVAALKPSHAVRAPLDDPHTPREAAACLKWQDADDPGAWVRIEREFRDGHRENWWATDLTFGGRGPDKDRRLVVITTDPASLPELTTRYLETNLPAPGAPVCRDAAFEPADVSEIARLYGLRNWVEQGYKQIKQELGWADFQVRSGEAIQRHWAVVCCAFSFCWWNWFRVLRAADQYLEVRQGRAVVGREQVVVADGEKNRRGRHRHGHRTTNERGRVDAVFPNVASGVAPGAGMADALDMAATLVARLVIASAANIAAATD
jgi:hypothetical protein